MCRLAAYRGRSRVPVARAKPALPALDALDVEAVEVPPDSTGATRESDDRAANPPPAFAEPTEPPSAPAYRPWRTQLPMPAL